MFISVHKYIKRFCYSNRVFLIALSALLLIPLCFSAPWGKRWPLGLGLPTVLAGDEPHFLIMINSLVNDGDLELKNNYASVHRGSSQAGMLWAGTPLDHHTVWYLGGERLQWAHIFELDNSKWQEDSAGWPKPTIRQGITVDVSDLPEYSHHPAGLAFLLAPFLFPFRGTSYLEPMAVFYSGIAVVLAMMFFRLLIQEFTSDLCLANLVTALAFLGTPVWHYGRTLFTEPFLLFFAISAYFLALRKRMSLLPGCLMAAGILMKLPFLLLMLPLLVDLLIQKRFKRVVFFSLPVVISVALTFFMNYTMFGSPFKTTQHYIIGNFKEGTIGLLLFWDHGILPFAPVVLIALLAWPKFMRNHFRESLMFATGFILYFLLMAFYGLWHGGWCYGPRYVVPVIPFLLMGLVNVIDFSFYRKVWGKIIIFSICVLSIVINFLGAVPYWKYWNKHPLIVLLTKI